MNKERSRAVEGNAVTGKPADGRRSSHLFASALSGRPARAFIGADGSGYIDDGREVRLSRLQALEIVRLSNLVETLADALERLLKGHGAHIDELPGESGVSDLEVARVALRKAGR